MHNSDHSFPCLKKKQRKKNFQKLSEAKSSAYNFCFNYKQTNYMHGPSLFLSILSVNHQVVYLIHHISQPFSTSNNPIGYVNNATHTQNNNNEWTNERMIRPHNLQKSLNKLPSCTCKQNDYMLLPNKEAYQYLDRPAHHRMWLLENDQSPISRTGVWMQTPWGSQNPDKYMMPSQTRAFLSQPEMLIMHYLCLRWWENIPES